MQLKAIELTGFKSFAKKTELELTAPVTAIVGPNGSGKSNVAEAIRFVLGEQSMKSMRGKAGTDMIFKGSPKLSAVSRASVTITFDNRDKKSAPFGDGQSVVSSFSDFDEIRVSRELYGDGSNEYKVNGSQVRLKDVMELLASAKIGGGGHHIISQGEADRVLYSSERERKEMIEDALGLKLYQWRIKESERKMERMAGNIREAEISRREIAPHLTYLKRQVEKIEKADELRQELIALYRPYLAEEALIIEREKRTLQEQGSVRDIEHKLSDCENELAGLEKENRQGSHKWSERESEVNRHLEEFKNKKDSLVRALGRLEGQIAALGTRVTRSPEEKISIPLSSARSFSDDLEEKLNQVSWRLERHELKEALALFAFIKKSVQTFFGEALKIEEEPQINNDGNLAKFEEEKNAAEEELVALEEKTKEASAELEKIRREERETEKESHERERRRYELMGKRGEFRNAIEFARLKENELSGREERMQSEIAEGSILVGSAVLEYTRGSSHPSELSQDELRRKIERLKIRIEDAGIGNPEEVNKEYKEVLGRDEFLGKEISDLIDSRNKLVLLIEELEEKLATEFNRGLDHINKEFDRFFKEMFQGGEASLDLVRIEKRRRAVEEIEGEEKEEEESEFEEGIDIKVSLPQKKVRDLNMLSGGERALTSIALLFAVSQVNPPPFLVLDETDAALDEANSKRYGNMVEALSKHSKLIVITHNRETMSRANVLYGVTIGSDGASRILSVRLDEAENYAK